MPLQVSYFSDVRVCEQNCAGLGEDFMHNVMHRCVLLLVLLLVAS